MHLSDYRLALLCARAGLTQQRLPGQLYYF